MFLTHILKNVANTPKSGQFEGILKISVFNHWGHLQILQPMKCLLDCYLSLHDAKDKMSYQTVTGCHCLSFNVFTFRVFGCFLCKSI